jgi:hypothetical protein
MNTGLDEVEIQNQSVVIQDQNSDKRQVKERL